jgi:hypothetical protein
METCALRRAEKARRRLGVTTMNSTMMILLIGAAVLIGLLLLGGASAPVDETDQAGVLQTAGQPSQASSGYYSTVRQATRPLVDAGPSLTVREREQVQLSGTGSDPAGGPVTFSWTAQGGLGFFSNPHIANPVYTAPSACDCESVAILTLTVANSAGLQASDQLTIIVQDPTVCPVETPCSSVASCPVDPCAETDEQCPVADVACETPCITQAPVTGGCEVVPVPCICSGGDCGDGWTTGWPLETQQPDHPRDRPRPLIDRQYIGQVVEGGIVPLRAEIQNPACVSVCFTWSASKGWFEHADTLEPIYHAPESDAQGLERATVTLTIYDGFGGRSFDQIRIEIRNTH